MQESRLLLILRRHRRCQLLDQGALRGPLEHAGAGTPPLIGGTANGCTDADASVAASIEQVGSDNCGEATLFY